jgi:hypothetical protein
VHEILSREYATAGSMPGEKTMRALEFMAYYNLLILIINIYFSAPERFKKATLMASETIALTATAKG